MEHSCAGTFISSYDMLHIAEKLHRKTPTLNHLHKRAGLTMMQCILSYRRNSKGHTFSGHQIRPRAHCQILWDKTQLLLFFLPLPQLPCISGLVQAVTCLLHTPYRHHHNLHSCLLLLLYIHHRLNRCSLHLLWSCNHRHFHNRNRLNSCIILQCSCHLCNVCLLLAPAA